jgi:hypothetical protein
MAGVSAGPGMAVPVRGVAVVRRRGPGSAAAARLSAGRHLIVLGQIGRRDGVHRRAAQRIAVAAGPGRIGVAAPAASARAVVGLLGRPTQAKEQ